MDSSTRENSSAIHLIATSSASINEFSNNNANRFTNILQNEIDLDIDTDYKIGLVNLHTPSYCCILDKNDHLSSNIQYNIGLFNYSEGGYTLDANKHKKIFSSAPNSNKNGGSIY